MIAPFLTSILNTFLSGRVRPNFGEFEFNFWTYDHDAKASFLRKVGTRYVDDKFFFYNERYFLSCMENNSRSLLSTPDTKIPQKDNYWFSKILIFLKDNLVTGIMSCASF